MRNLILRASVLFAMLLPLACTAQPEAFVEGEHYKTVRNVEEASNDRIMVTEVFWYGCPHCFSFEPHIDRWKAERASDVDFERLPTALGRASGRLHVKAYFTAMTFDQETADAVHRGMFSAIHERNQRLASKQEVAAVFEAAGVAPADFEKAFEGFTVENRTRRAEKRVADFGVASVPTVIVDGRWQVGAAQAGSFEQMVAIIDFLVNKARSQR